MSVFEQNESRIAEDVYAFTFHNGTHPVVNSVAAFPKIVSEGDLTAEGFGGVSVGGNLGLCGDFFDAAGAFRVFPAFAFGFSFVLFVATDGFVGDDLWGLIPDVYFVTVVLSRSII